jgi:predicted DsbA family dithiol-disulfide isomerase
MKWKHHIMKQYTIKNIAMSKQKQFKHNLEKVKRIKNFNAKTNNESTLHEMFEQMFNSYKDIYTNDILTDLNKLK